MKVLVINGNVRGDQSRTWKMTEAFLDEIKKGAPEGTEFTQLDLAEMNLKPLVGQFFEDRQVLLETPDRSHPRFDLAHQFAQADKIVVSAPFWDLSIPAILKIYIENISVDGITFGCNEEGIYGLSKATNMTFLTTRGSFYGDGPLEQGAKYLEALCVMFGVDEFQCIAAEGLDMDPSKVDALMDEATWRAKQAARTYWG